jgi:hypothetical protein
MRPGSALLILLACAGCAWLAKPVAQAPAAQQTAAVAASPAADAQVAPRFECSDGTISVSQSVCLVNMARARLPPQPPTAPARVRSEPMPDPAR